ncbi:maleylpyruvate isomerase family mycothiol-dependent enzyme [Actinoplanes solisilvae]|uniref:maleylpyruvate isomerase family mycothiol-dependent enzyme n=1 Tax=Actinoplanes solisilvae TaxID=2486853 RepID=UPI000FD95537|nr:maleylpyruvate isomerase family mycothiol-dependent enzyme [Actinoplanes solisilvae]
MNRDQIWDVIVTERRAVVALLESLSADEWQQQSLCSRWTIHDVGAHLTMQQMGLSDAFPMMRQWQGSLARTIAHTARVRAAALTPEQIVTELRDTAGRRRRNIGVTRLETLTDVLVHTQDIAIPLGRQHTMPAEAAAECATRTLSMRWPPPLPSVRAVAGLRLTATDVDWSAGQGPEVRGPMEALLLTITGRHVWRDRLSGEGVARL